MPGACFPDLVFGVGPAGWSVLVLAVAFLRLEPLRVSAFRVFFFGACALAGGVPPDMAAEVDAFAGMEQNRDLVSTARRVPFYEQKTAVRRSAEQTRRNINNNAMVCHQTTRASLDAAARSPK